jgi:hypothetical protein
MAHTYGPGLVLHMYPDELLRFGASHTAEPDEAVAAQHYFLCISADDKGGLWAPLYLTRGQDRLPILEADKHGHGRWTRGTSFYSPDELWRIPHKAAQRGAQAAGDKSGPRDENRVELAAVPAREVFPADSALRTHARS